jgi:formylglycine-generating enzyme required for sulfatase activity
MSLEITNSIGMKLALIPAGEFLMGSPETELDRRADEPQHRVRITKPFYLGVYEVTQAEYERVMGTNPSAFSTGGLKPNKVSGNDTSRYPVENVSWEDAVEFCRKLSSRPEEQRAGRRYRLPTEAEWEYACRAGTTTPFHFGTQLDGREANCDGTYPYGTESKGQSLERTTTVGSYAPNAFRLYDMHGNVREWCQDWYEKDYYSGSPVDDPQGPASASYAVRAYRGGGWREPAARCRTAEHGWVHPFHRYRDMGFRVALVRAPPEKVPAEKAGEKAAERARPETAPAEKDGGKPAEKVFEIEKARPERAPAEKDGGEAGERVPPEKAPTEKAGERAGKKAAKRAAKRVPPPPQKMAAQPATVHNSGSNEGADWPA